MQKSILKLQLYFYILPFWKQAKICSENQVVFRQLIFQFSGKLNMLMRAYNFNKNKITRNFMLIYFI